MLAENGIEYVVPNELQQARMGKFILNLVVGQQKPIMKNLLASLMILKIRFDCALLACTDLQLLVPNHPKLKIFDTMKIFAEATVAEIVR